MCAYPQLPHNYKCLLFTYTLHHKDSSSIIVLLTHTIMAFYIILQHLLFVIYTVPLLLGCLIRGEDHLPHQVICYVNIVHTTVYCFLWNVLCSCNMLRISIVNGFNFQVSVVILWTLGYMNVLWLVTHYANTTVTMRMCHGWCHYLQ